MFFLLPFGVSSLFLGFFFFNDTATTEIYTLSLHDALPITRCRSRWYPRTPPGAGSRLRSPTAEWPVPASGSRPRTSVLRRGRSRAGRARRLLRQRRVGLRASHRLAARIVVKEHEAAVDEGPEVCRPPDPRFLLLHVLPRSEPDLRGVRARGHGKEATAPSEVDDLSVVGGGLLRHARALSQPKVERNRSLPSTRRRVKRASWVTPSTWAAAQACSFP